MAAPRFFVDAELLAGAATRLPRDVAHHAEHVLRLRAGDAVTLFNGRGGEFHGVLTARGAVKLHRHAAVEREAPVDATLVQAWIANDKLHWVVEKAVELGAARIVLVPAHRSVVRLDAARLARRLARLREVAVAACCQCGRNRVPAIEPAADLASVLRPAGAGAGARAVLLQPDASESLVAAVQAAPDRFVVAVGPEGGFDAAERADAERAGYRPVRLGPRVLRTETAGLAALAALQAAAGDFAQPG